MLDCKIAGASVVDGTGSPRRRADVGISDGRITAVGETMVASWPNASSGRASASKTATAEASALG